MFIAMNRFRVAKGSEEAFENAWLSRDSYLHTVPGFVEFHYSKVRRPKITAVCVPHRMEEPDRVRGLDRRILVPFLRQMSAGIEQRMYFGDS